MMKKIGRYEVREVLGGGGMAVVYRAYDPYFKRDVAIKVISEEFLHVPQFHQRFEREAQVSASLEHPAIVPVYDFGKQDDQPYLVMRLLSGGSLHQNLIKNTKISLNEAVQLLERITPALDIAHAQQIIHRDLKPANILFDEYGNPYITDFGIAKLLAETTVELTKIGQVTKEGQIIGTPPYMSPEQGRGDKDIDKRADIYALGVMLFKLLTGELPFHAKTRDGFIYKHIHEQIPNILERRPDLPRGCQNVIEKAMAKDRNARYTTTGEMREALKMVVPSAPPAQPKNDQINNILKGVIIGVLISGILVLLLLATGIFGA